MTHLELAAHESRMAEETPFCRWAGRVETILGHSLDGDQEADGYSLDFARDAYMANRSPRAYAATVLLAKQRLT